jgi:hypothetical protein
MPKRFDSKLRERIFNLEVRPDDVWIDTYPKCGTTWSQVIKLAFKSDLFCKSKQNKF